MENKKVSVVIPARNEEKFIQKTLESLKNTTAWPFEIIVVVNGSNDNTLEIAQRFAEKVFNFEKALGPGGARNEGAKVAKGDIYVFLDADTEVSKNAISEVIKNSNGNSVGSCSANISESKTDKKLRAKIFFAFKNFIHKTKVYKGSIALIFCSNEIFWKINGFNKNMWVGELHDFLKRAASEGAEYKFLENCSVVTSLRRYEKKGYLQTFVFWIKWKILSIFKKKNKLNKKYFK